MSTDADLRTLANHMRSRLVLRACITNAEWKTVAGKLDAIADTIATHTPDDALTFTPPDHGFDCFHCGSHFAVTDAGIAAAREHFGPTPASAPACRTALHLIQDFMVDWNKHGAQIAVENLHRGIKSAAA